MLRIISTTLSTIKWKSMMYQTITSHRFEVCQQKICQNVFSFKHCKNPNEIFYQLTNGHYFNPILLLMCCGRILKEEILAHSTTQVTLICYDIKNWDKWFFWEKKYHIERAEVFCKSLKVKPKTVGQNLKLNMNA